MFKPIGLRNEKGFYEAFSVTDWSAVIQLCATPEQHEYNRSTVECPECKGWGYRMQRRGRETIREAAGCPTCLGLGKLPLNSAAPDATQSEGADGTSGRAA